jgi:Tol biopolymer transport system component
MVVDQRRRPVLAAGRGGTGTAQPIEITGLPPINNDHVLAPDGETVYASADDGHIYACPLAGGEAVRVTNDPPSRTFFHYLHGVSPDGSILAYVGLDHTAVPLASDIYLVPSTGGPDVRITNTPKHKDGCEYSPDGQWIYLNTEDFSDEVGHAQVARLRPDGSGLEQLTYDDRVNWFPHWAPDGSVAVYLSYPPGTNGHPPNLPVELRLVTGHAWRSARTVVSLFGGQGTINVNSWAPDSSRFACVAYPMADAR